MGFEADSEYDPLPGVGITLLRGKGDALIEPIENQDHDAGLHSIGVDVEDPAETVADLKSKGARIVMEPVPTLVGRSPFSRIPTEPGARASEYHGEATVER